LFATGDAKDGERKIEIPVASGVFASDNHSNRCGRPSPGTDSPRVLIMRAIQISLCFVLLVVAVACSSLTTVPGVSVSVTSNKDKIVGTWEVTKPDIVKGMTYDFSKDGKLKVSGGPSPTLDGTYTVDGDTLNVTVAGKVTTSKIKVLTDKDMTLEETKTNKSTEFKKK
jgi:uncharacterized protein (TIGR03066 family)